jgi:uncharacterized membrane protein YedE/YeeE
MTPAEAQQIADLTHTVLWATFALAFVFGAVSQRTGFCTMGAVADIVTFGDWTRMRQWLLAIGVAIAGTQALAAAGLIDTADSFYTAPRLIWLANALGGLLFGFGMVLASGCGARTLVRAGAGNLKSVVVFIVLGVTAYVSLRGALAVLRVGAIEPFAIDVGGRQDLPALLSGATGAGKAALHATLGALAGGGLIAFALARRDFLRFDNLLAGIAIGAIIVAVWFVSGHVGRLDEHPATLERAFLGTATGKMESLTFVAPVAATLDWLMLFSDAGNTLTLGVAAVFGTLGGSAAYALAGGRFRWEGFRGTEDTANHLVGGMLMGFGGVTAVGCTIGQGLSGVSTLAIGSLIAWAAIVGGAVLGLRYQAWRVERTA